MADGYVQVPANVAGGNKIDTTELTRYDGTVVERERVAIPDVVAVDGDIFRQILIELRLISLLLAQENNVNDNLNQLRADIAQTENLN